jgi:hypothetical protein
VTRDVLLLTSFRFTTMSLPTPDAGSRTPPRSATGQTAKTSPARVKDKYYLPENREQYQKFGYDDRLIKKTFNEGEFLDYLGFKDEDLAPKPKDYKAPKTKKGFSKAANVVARAIKKRREHYLFLCLAFLADI